MHSDSYDIAIRRLNVPRTDEMRQQTEAFISEIANVKCAREDVVVVYVCVFMLSLVPKVSYFN